MSTLSITEKTVLEAVLNMSGGYVLDFTNATFANFFGELNVDIYDHAKYPGFGDSKANRLRALWKSGSNAEAATSLNALADYIEAKKETTDDWGSWLDDITDEKLVRVRKIASDLIAAVAASAAPLAPGIALSSVTASAPAPPPTPVAITTEATVTKNKIEIEIHEDIYSHIKRYLDTEDYFHAVEESYKVVREKLREITGSEKATDAVRPANFEKLFGHQPATEAESDFFDGVKYLNMAIQFLRNEKAHTLANAVEPNLAIHYISLASLAYDLITRYVSEETIKEVEQLVYDKRNCYGTVSAFLRVYEDAKWLDEVRLPAALNSASVRRVLKVKWLQEADFTVSWAHSTVQFMRFELVVDELTADDIDRLLDLPTVDSYGNDQMDGLDQFLRYVDQQDPSKLSVKAQTRMLI
ncbi:TIGR02391 family protein [Promicromonospora sp. NPDC059942]|uniref:TIGR02391 family protein n=1 Tax=Promicromonospora sp. NPDC059942 TaxID=3347009 RepID=UPI00365B6D6F